MKFKVLLLSLGLALTSGAFGQEIGLNGVANNGSGGVYEINGLNYWWMCVEPGTAQVANAGSSFLAQATLFEQGWDQQNTERLATYQSDLSLYTGAIPKQVSVMEYVLDTYLPWNSLAGASGRFAEQDSNAANYANNDAFYNAFFVVQNFLAETYGKTVIEDFTDTSSYLDYYAADMTAAGIARSSLFQMILADVELKDAANFFDSYTATHGYFIANTLRPQADPGNYQDALIIASFTPVPEPGGAMLIGCCGLAVLMRRWRKLA